MSFLLLIYLLLLHVSQLQKYKIQAFTEKKKNNADRRYKRINESIFHLCVWKVSSHVEIVFLFTEGL